MGDNNEEIIGKKEEEAPFPLTDVDRWVLSQTDEEFKYHDWEELQEIIGEDVLFTCCHSHLFIRSRFQVTARIRMFSHLRISLSFRRYFVVMYDLDDSATPCLGVWPGRI
jgi:hypothetical protein